MKFATLKTYILSLITLFVISCVNVSLPESTYKAKNVSFKAPPKPFQQVFPHEIDAAWRHISSNTTISFYTECKNPTNPSTENIIKGAISALKDPVVTPIESYKLEDDILAKKAQATGKVGSVDSKIEVVVAKYEECIYLLSLVSTEKNFPKVQSFFENFKAEFKIK